ncbi:hypothetical protein [Rhizobium sp. WSM1325]|uniref:hypothetical protein n=1 Tax=Rhizobium sp. WSM1325 TaxID=3444086 RepID=UPI000FF2AC10|nr:hypothetical protein [Rhizobium leguminosarum]RWY75273.1 hypothetical protein EHI48_19020 [Rhizobium leguminosarum]
MIRIQRLPAQAAEAALERIGRRGLTEREHALWHFGGVRPIREPLPPRPDRAPNFTAYKCEAVKTALSGLFGTKCAYCESPYAHLASMEVEHFRPKGGYIDDDGEFRSPGYYWLAASYDNLLPSCIDCNRERKHFHRTKNGQRVPTKSGKANRFPIAPGTQRATRPVEMANERPLLLDPCIDNPDQHLRFYADGFVEPATSAEEDQMSKGRATIDVYGLVREALVSERRRWAILVEAAMQGVLTADRNVRAHPLDPDMVDQRAIAETALAFFVQPGSQYLAMTTTMVSTFRLVRAAAQHYHLALAAWNNTKTVEDRTALVERAAVIQRIRGDVLLEQKLVAQLFKQASVPDF